MTPPISRRQLHPEGSRTDAARLYCCVSCLTAVWLPKETSIPARCQCSPGSFMLWPIKNADRIVHSPDAQVGAIGEPVALDYARWHFDHSSFYRDLTDAMCRQIAECLHHFDRPDLSLDRMSEAQVEEFNAGSIDRFKNEARFRARVDALTYAVVRVTRTEIETALAAPQPPSAPSQSGEVAQKKVERDTNGIPMVPKEQLIAEIIRDMCESTPADPNNETTVCIHVDELEAIVRGSIESFFNTLNTPQHATDQLDELSYEMLLNTCRRFKCEMDARTTEVAQLQGELTRLRGLMYVPGFWQCKKCGLGLTKSILNIGSSGPLVASDEAPEACPNCNVPMWRVSERDQRCEAQQEYEKIFDERNQLRDQLAALQADRDIWKDAIFLCTITESVHAAVKWMCAYHDEQMLRLKTKYYDPPRYPLQEAIAQESQQRREK